MQKKQGFFLFIPKSVLLSFMFFASLQAQAQDDENGSLNDDSTQMIDTETASDKTKTDENNTHYFLRKDQFDQTNDSLLIRKIPDSWINDLKNDEDYWYANAEIKKEKEPEPDLSYVPLGRRTWFQTLLWLVIIGGFAAFIIWYLAGNNIGLFQKKQRIIDGSQEEMETEDIFAINYQKEIDKASGMGNYRLAIRLMFLRLLKELSEKNIIQYAQGKTNFDYLAQLHPTKYYKDFFRITRNYEYSWYGQFDVNEETYHIIRSDFNSFDRQLK